MFKTLILLIGCVCCGCATNAVLPLRTNTITAQELKYHFKNGQRGVEYQAEGRYSDYWKTPREVWIDKGGDCEDLSIYMFKYLQDRGIDSYLCLGKYCDSDGSGHHVWLETVADNWFFLLDPAGGNMYSYPPSEYQPAAWYVKKYFVGQYRDLMNRVREKQLKRKMKGKLVIK